MLVTKVKRKFNFRFIRNFLKANCFQKLSTRLQLVCLMIGTYFLLNIISITSSHQSSLSMQSKQSLINLPTNYISNQILSTVERSTRALERLKYLLTSVSSPGAQPWIWTPTQQYPSVPYQPSSLLHHVVPKVISNMTNLPECVLNEVNRVCKRLIKADKIGGNIWCKLFNETYTKTLATTTTLLDDGSTYIITGDIDLMWLRDSSAQVHHYLPLWKDPQIQRIIEGLILRQVQFIYANPYASSFRLTLRPNPPSDDSLEPIHVEKGRNLHVAMHNYELDSLCYHIRLSYSWWKQSQRKQIFNNRWLISIEIILQLLIVEQHHSQISPYRYTELIDNNHQGSSVAYTGMTWTAFRPSDDQTKYGYLIPSNMMACVVLEYLFEMISNLFPEQIQLLKQISQLRVDILSGINTYGIANHGEYGKIYVYETNGFSQHLLLDDANIPSLLSAFYLGFKTPYDPFDAILHSTYRFILSINNSLFFQGKYASGIGSQHTAEKFIWPMAIIMEGFASSIHNDSQSHLDYVWKRLELNHVDKYSMHESFCVDDPKQYTRQWFAWADSLFAELVLTYLDSLEDWLHSRRSI